MANLAGNLLLSGTPADLDAGNLKTEALCG
jgi:hypothetical protein